ncbi:hypothetical protein C8F01DRAFT_512808 [Mycena amicta]|nr:hypothetical protein C8F01DRAFT_512808 [Mycena amicta]
MPTDCHSFSSSSAHSEQVPTPAANVPRTDSSAMSDCQTRSTDSVADDHDETYYLSTGDASLCLDGVVFKVHKAIFSRDPDSHSPSTNGQLFEGSAEDFRAFCWAMYASPYEIHMQTSPDVGYANVPRLLRVASIAKRHHLHKLRAWALDVVFGLCLDRVDAEGKRSSYVDSETCSAEMLCRIFSIAKSEGRTDVVKRLLDNMDIELESDESESVSPRGTGSDSDGEWVDFEAIMDGPPGMHEQGDVGQ